MNLKELKSMIAEEYRYWLAEQPIDAPGVEVGPNDVDAMGGGDSEATLRQIYDMLKSYFEGGAGAGEAMPAGGADMGDMDAVAAGDDDIEGADMDDADMDDMDDMGDDAEEEKDDDVEEGKDKDEDEDDKKALQERFKKLANIIKG